MKKIYYILIIFLLLLWIGLWIRVFSNPNLSIPYDLRCLDKEGKKLCGKIKAEQSCIDEIKKIIYLENPYLIVQGINYKDSIYHCTFHSPCNQEEYITIPESVLEKCKK